MNHRYKIPPNFDSSKFTLFGIVRLKVLIEAIGISYLVYIVLNYILKIFDLGEVFELINIAFCFILCILLLVSFGDTSFSESVFKRFSFINSRRKLRFRTKTKHYKLKSPVKETGIIKNGIREIIEKDNFLNFNSVKNELYTQEFLPIKEISDSYIKLRDGSFVKILEINATNFLTLKPHEQMAIINDFTRMLKVSPEYIQLKIISKHSDLSKYVNHLKELTNSDTEESKTLVDLTDEVSSQLLDLSRKTVLEHRYFLIFTCKPKSDLKYENEIIQYVLNDFSSKERAISDKLLKRGVTIVNPRNNQNFSDLKDYYTDLLYSFYNRNSSQIETYTNRIEKIYGVNNLQLRNFKPDYIVAPRGIDLSQSDYIIMDGRYYTYLVINDFPNEGVVAGWLGKYTNVGEGFDFDIFIQKADKSEIRDKLKKRNLISKTNADQMSRFSFTHNEVKKIINATNLMIKNLEGDNEFYFFLILCTISAESYEELINKKEWLIELFKSYDFKTKCPKYEMEDAFKISQPLALPVPKFFDHYRRNILSDSIKSFYPFTTASTIQESGISLGINIDDHSPVVLDIFNPISNMFVFGITGYGKSFLCMLIATRLRLMQTQVYILAPAKGHEYKNLAENLNGSFIQIGPGSKNCINILEVRPIKKFDDINQDDAISLQDSSYLNEKIQDLLIFFDLITDSELSNISKNLLSPFLIDFYKKFGITDNNKSIYKPDGSLKDMPILGDLYEALEKTDVKELNELTIPLKKFIQGNLSYFNNQTNVDLDNKFCVIDISKAMDYKETRELVIYITQNYIWNKVRSDRTERKAIIFEEIWKLLENKESAALIREMFKTIRGYYGICIGITQNLQDLVKDSFQGSDGILNNTLIQIFLHNTSDESYKLMERFELTDYEYALITGAAKGEALIVTPEKHISTKILATQTESQLFETDGNKL